MVEGEGEGWQKSSGWNADVRAFFLGFIIHFYCNLLPIPLPIHLSFSPLPVSLSFFLSSPQNAIIGFFGSSRGCLFGILFRGSLVVQEARVATAKGW